MLKWENKQNIETLQIKNSIGQKYIFQHNSKFKTLLYKKIIKPGNKMNKHIIATKKYKIKNKD